MTTYITLKFDLSDYTLTLPLKNFKGTVNWGDGSSPDTYSTITTGPSHVYASLNIYDVSLSTVTNLPWFGYDVSTNTNYQNSIISFEYNTKITSLINFSYAFYNCTNFTSFTTSLPSNTNNVADMSRMFDGASNFNSDITLNCSSCKDLAYFLQNATSFNSSISLINTSNVSDMSQMFYGATIFNQPVTLNCSSCESFQKMFSNATSFNSSISLTNTSNVLNMSQMFDGATVFNQPVTLNCSSCESFYKMFSNATSFNSSISLTNTSNVTTMYEMFYGATVFNQPVTLNCSSCNFFVRMFYNASSFNNTLTLTNTSNVEYMSGMFWGATNFNQPISLDCSSNFVFTNFLNGATSFNNTLNLTPVPSLIDATNMLVNTSLSTENYSALIELWGSQTSLNSDVTLTATGIKYNQAAETEHNYLTSTKGWTIDDGGSIAPTIASCTPQKGLTYATTVVTITGANLNYNTVVKFGSYSAIITSYADDKLVCSSPYITEAGNVTVTVTTDYGEATTSFTYYAIPDTEPQYTTGSYNSTSSLGSGARTFASMVISGSHGKKASQNRIYNYANRRGQGNEYKNYLIDAMGIKYQPKVNPWSYM